MDKKLIALVHLIVATEMSKVSLKEGPQGPRGHKGRDGNSFDISEHEETLREFIKQNARIELTPEQLESLVGPQGPQGPRGFDGNSVEIDDVLPPLTEKVTAYIDSIKEDLKLKFSDLTEDEQYSLRGKRGQRGERGHDFDFEENRDQIQNIICEYVNEISDKLKLTFDDLTDDQKHELRGPKGDRGERGHDGQDFSFEESKPLIVEAISTVLEEKKEDFKLKFEDLTDEEKDSLSLKFDDLTYEQKKSLRGKRGQIGKPGQDGEKGDRGSLWLTVDSTPTSEQGAEGDMALSKSGDVFIKEFGAWNKKTNIRGQDGLHGLDGINGRDGRDGRNGRDGADGRDGAEITRVDVDVDYFRKEYTFKFTLSDGRVIETPPVEIPVETKVVNHSYSYYSSGSDSGGGSGKTYFFDPNYFFTTSTNDKTNVTLKPTEYNPDDFEVVVGQDKFEISLKSKAPQIEFSDDFTTELEDGILKVGLDVDIPPEINFDPADFVVTPNPDGSINVSSTDSGGGSSEISISDEGDLVSKNITNINFVGDNVRVRPRITLSEWELMSDVVPTIADYVPVGVVNEVDVVIDLPDRDLIQDVPCEPNMTIGALVYIDEFAMARKAKADLYETSNVIGVVERLNGISKCDIRVGGLTGELYDNLDTSLDYYLSDTVAGEISPFVPTVSGHVKLRVGQSFGRKRLLLQKGERLVRL